MVREGITTTVRVDQLVEILKENREQHIKDYEVAVKGYVKVQTEKLQEMLKQLEDGKVLEDRYLEVAPDLHTDDFDEAIEMLEMTTDSEITLTSGQFRAYVRGDFAWKEHWKASNSHYTQAALG